MPNSVVRPRFSGVVLSVSDIQYPFLDKPSVACALRIAKALAPVDCLVFNGDLLDFDTLSPKFTTSPSNRRNGEQVRQDCDELGDLLTEFRVAARAKMAVYLGGNHEERPEKLLRTFLPVLDGAVRLDEWLRLADRGIQYVPYLHGNGHIRLGDRQKGLYILHGFKYRGGKKGRSALGHIDSVDCSVMHGHTNACVSIQVKKPSRILYGVEQGCLCNLNAMSEQYAPFPDAQHGVGYAELKDGELQFAEAVRIVEGVAHLPTQRIEV